MFDFAIEKRVLNNGLTVIVLPHRQIPKVSVQLWYDVGSKDESSQQKGIAHLIEHMIFKGTNTLSESDINLITHKLSGSCNAFTSHDYTGYMFDFPSHNWHHALPIMADCMVNCTFREDLLSSELKAVIQELKMYNDDFVSSLLEKMAGAIFFDHPYHYPVIGYKQDLWRLKRENLLQFYKQHYGPNNATLVIVGDVDPSEAFDYAEKYFGSIENTFEPADRDYYHGKDIVSQSVHLYRDVQQPIIMLAWEVPGAIQKKDYSLDVFSWLVGAGKGSRLNSKILDELGLVNEIESFVYDLFEYGLFVVYYQPKKIEDVDYINQLIKEELASMYAKGFADSELRRAIKKTELDFVSLGEDVQRLAYLIGKYYLATGDENYLATYRSSEASQVKEDIYWLLSTYMRPSLMHEGRLLPLLESDKDQWATVQQQSDKEDARVLSGITRDTIVEEGVHVHLIGVSSPKKFEYPRAQSMRLTNGLKVLYHNNPMVPKIEVILDLKTRGYYDPDDKQGLNTFLMDLLDEGTKTYPGSSFSQELESYGMSLNLVPGQITMSMLSNDVEKGLGLLADILVNAQFSEKAIEKVRGQLISDIIQFWDTPLQFIGQLAREAVYGVHPYHKAVLGKREVVASLARNDLLSAYEYYLTPCDARIVIVGDLSSIDIENVLEKTLGGWNRSRVEDIVFPSLEPTRDRLLDYTINRDQAVLAFAGLSVSRLDPDYDPLLLFDQVLTGGVLGSMSSRLFSLREQTGLFYTIGGSVISGANREPGMMFIKTIVSHERLEEAQKAISAVIDNGAQDLSEEELEESKQAISHALVENFASNRSMAATFLFLDKFNFPEDFFDNRASQIQQVSLSDVKHAVKRHVATDKMTKIRIGRL